MLPPKRECRLRLMRCLVDAERDFKDWLSSSYPTESKTQTPIGLPTFTSIRIERAVARRSGLRVDRHFGENLSTKPRKFKSGIYSLYQKFALFIFT